MTMSSQAEDCLRSARARFALESQRIERRLGHRAFHKRRARYEYIHRRLAGLHSQNSDLPNIRELAKELHVSPGVIKNDLTFMRNDLGLPVTFVSNGVRYSNGYELMFDAFDVADYRVH